MYANLVLSQRQGQSESNTAGGCTESGWSNVAGRPNQSRGSDCSSGSNQTKMGSTQWPCNLVRRMD